MIMLYGICPCISTHITYTTWAVWFRPAEPARCSALMCAILILINVTRILLYYFNYIAFAHCCTHSSRNLNITTINFMFWAYFQVQVEKLHVQFQLNFQLFAYLLINLTIIVLFFIHMREPKKSFKCNSSKSSAN